MFIYIIFYFDFLCCCINTYTVNKSFNFYNNFTFWSSGSKFNIISINFKVFCTSYCYVISYSICIYIIRIFILNCCTYVYIKFIVIFNCIFFIELIPIKRVELIKFFYIYKNTRTIFLLNLKLSGYFCQLF